MKKILELKNISLTYHSKESETLALDGVTFDIQKEEFVAIVGPSGCGKTTILSLLAQLNKPSSGEILLEGKPLTKEKNISGLMPQRDQLFEWRSIFKNVMLGLEIQKKKNDKNTAYAKSLLNKYGLEEFIKKYPNELSGGMRQRVALIRTLVSDPMLLLLDEPFSALDFQTRISVCDDVYKIIKEEKKTALLVTHDISEAISMSDRIIVLTERPAKVKAIIDINLDKNLSPLKRREQPQFAPYFKQILELLS